MPPKNPKTDPKHSIGSTSRGLGTDSEEGTVHLAIPSKCQVSTEENEGKESNKKLRTANADIFTSPEKMAVGIVSEALQDVLLSDCYENLNNRKYTGKYVDFKHQECDESFRLLHIIDDFTKDTNNDLLLRNMKHWVSFEQEFPYINTSRIAMNHLYKMPVSMGFLQYVPQDSAQPKVAKVISIGKISHCRLVSAEQINVKGDFKSVKSNFVTFLRRWNWLGLAYAMSSIERNSPATYGRVSSQQELNSDNNRSQASPTPLRVLFQTFRIPPFSFQSTTFALADSQAMISEMMV
ncbi:hypothetical protein BDP27DRAFT_1333997 [Rhodocollybia butyracea]|uniref:Uncharacterized protein n=1 Tax=Rhodocollybia butyracea TaxID=206335 RepID=A0A9P5PKD8_9AGAR|nr:hypothetical protein BDP27DRAFT_1333997 [Rhodocollybia butyracea]